tara:strand:+ start:864 stop:1178 length:315 start_codon:yes stop_codon:yes gene_type:complete
MARNNKGQFVKGKSGNPSGRPKNQTFTKELRVFMNSIDHSGIHRLEYIVNVLYHKACEGDLTAIKMIMDRVDGLPTQHVETRTYDTIKVVDIDGIESPDDKIIS